MTEMVFLQGTFGSKVIFAGCPVCGRIGRQTLSESFSGKDHAAFSAAHQCPVCGTIYDGCSGEETVAWIGRFISYTEEPDGYNISARKGYARLHPEIMPAEEASPLDKKIAFWKGKLLDLTKRNRMLNYRDTRRSTLHITEPGFSELFNRLALEEDSLTFQRPVDRSTDLRTFSILALLETLSCPIPVRIGDIGTDGSYPERQNTLKNLRAKAKLAKEEQGTNILYLSFGFLEWREKNSAGAPWYRAPLLMMPVTLQLEKLSAPYTLIRDDDEIEVNPTLEHFLKEQFGVSLPHFELKGPSSAEEYMTAVETLADAHGWKVSRDVSLGLLSFLKISMYHDLEKNRIGMAKHPVICAIAGEGGAINIRTPEKAELDKIAPSEWYTVIDADSSQQEAILLSKQGISFVMQGPPGTGKSQTITNIIAEALAAGKKVLFVSEKAAALQVVLKRLAEVHLDDFCLSLHSHRANKKDILDSIGRNLKLRHTRVREGAMDELNELFHNRERLNAYAHELHETIKPLNESLYSVFGKLTGLAEMPDVCFTMDEPLSVSEQQFSAMVYALNSYERALCQMECSIAENPWNGTKVSSARQAFQKEFLMRTVDLDRELSDLNEALDFFGNLSGVLPEYTLKGAGHMKDLFDSLLHLPDFDKDWFDGEKRQELLTFARTMRQNTTVFRESMQVVENSFRESIFSEDLSRWIRTVQDNLQRLCEFCGTREEETAFADAGNCAGKLSVLQQELSLLHEKAEKASGLFCLESADLFPELEKIGRICTLLKKTPLTLQRAFDPAEIVQAELKLAQARKHAFSRKEKQTAVLKNWQESVFELDAEPMLERFHTEYTGLFKSLRGDYRTDMRTIRACCKNDGTLIEDADAVELLKTLCELRADEKWFADNAVSLKKHFAEGYVGPDTDWDAVSVQLSLLRELQGLYARGIIPVQVIGHLRPDTDIPDIDPESVRKLQQTAGELLPAKRSLSVRDMIHYASQAELICRDLLLLRHKLEEHMTGGNNACIALAQQAKKAAEVRERLLAAEERCTMFFKDRYCGITTDWNSIVSELERADAFFRTGMHGFSSELLQKLAEDHMLREKTVAFHTLLSDTLKQTQAKVKWFSDLFESPVPTDLRKIRERYLRCKDGFILLDRWLDLVEARKECAALGLGEFLRQTESQGITAVSDTFRRNFYQQWCSSAVETKPAVRTFRRRIQEERIERFSDLDKKQFAIAQARIREKVIDTFPDTMGLLTADDELRILQRELQKKRRIMPLRKLFNTIPHLLLTLKPCLMMSPLSVAYFLEASSYQFDMVIFDEASQVFPQDAIGAIARGKQVIIAGDSKQLPPTSFFASGVSEDDFDSETFDEPLGDSILEETTAVLPSRTLLWHYRSKHEHLIAFSNSTIYDGDLITFPSCKESEPDSGVEFCYVEDGVYETGKSCNAAEARRCVELVRQHIEKYSDRSLGIIAFSEKQQQLISGHIQRFREQNPQYEAFFKEGRDEEFFVKNLENVQGDERDTIIFSICYARTAEQKRSGKPMSMRFGPLGHAGGERRLNVAVTRAKRNIKLVSSILASDIDLTKTESEGIRMLRSYIEFARNGAVSLRQDQQLPASDSFSGTVADYLTKNGYHIRRQVGCSEYRIDLAVECPGMPGRFIAGIECDGVGYAAARTARDRDRLRSSVLTSMGWNMYRVWSAEWQNNPEIEGEKLLAFLRDMQAKIPAEIPVKELPVEEPVSEEVPDVEERPEDDPYGFPVYVKGDWTHARISDGETTPFAQQLLHVIAIEQPVHTELLYQRMTGAAGRQKVTPVVRRMVDDSLNALVQNGKIRLEREFCTLTGFSEVRVRIPAPGEQPRQINHISDEEIGLAMMAAAGRASGFTPDALKEETARILGYSRAGERIRERLDTVFGTLTANGQLILTGSKIYLRAEREDHVRQNSA